MSGMAEVSCSLSQFALDFRDDATHDHVGNGVTIGESFMLCGVCFTSSEHQVHSGYVERKVWSLTLGD